jgi:hypothetical protein
MTCQYVLDSSAMERFGTSLLLGTLLASAAEVGSHLLLPVLAYAERSAPPLTRRDTRSCSACAVGQR